MNKSTKRQVIRVLITASIPLLGLIFLLAYPYLSGEKLTDKKRYETYCGNCHGKEGEGFKDLYPPLAGSDYLIKFERDLPCIIRHGLKGTIKVNGKAYDQPMPELTFLKPHQITGIINFVNSSWGNNGKQWEKREVVIALERCKTE